MKTKYKNMILGMGSVLLIGGVITGFHRNGTSKMPDVGVPIEYLHATYSIDVNDTETVVGDADYVFKAEVLEKIGTEYRQIIEVQNEDGVVEKIGNPYTNYTVRITDNIKGELISEEPIQITKTGGLSQEGDSYIAFEGDIIPEVGNTYIFIAYAQLDGSLLVNGAQSTVEVPKQSRLATVFSNNSDKVTSTYENACENEIQSERDRIIANEDINH